MSTPVSERIQAKGILFDVGHTILFPNPDFFYQLAVQYGARMPRRDFDHLGARCKEKAYRENPANPYRQWFSEWMIQAGVASDALPRIYQQIHDRHRESHLWDTLEPSIPAIFSELRERGFTLGVVSNADGTVPDMLAELELDHFFKCIIDSGRVGVEKPDARIFYMALEAIGLKPDSCVYVGDQPEVDARGAAAVGITPVLLDPHWVLPVTEYRRIRKLMELLDIVEFG